jgi:putative hemolysin
MDVAMLVITFRGSLAMSSRWIYTCVCALLLAACSNAPTASSAAPAAQAPAAQASADATACTAKGGQLRPVGRMQIPRCIVPYADAGKTCTDNADCSGDCLATSIVPTGTATTGTCQRDSDRFGCRQEVVGGKGQAALCID